MKIKNRLDQRKRRHMRIRKKTMGSAEMPRMSVCVTGKNIYVQFIDDDAGITIASVSTVGSKTKVAGNNLTAAKSLGETASAVAMEKGIKKVRFDRGGHKYHGRVKAVADAAREAGIIL